MSEEDACSQIPRILTSQVEAHDHETMGHMKYCRLCLKDDAKVEEEIFVRVPVILWRRSMAKTLLPFLSLICVQTELRMTNLHLRCQIQVSARGKLEAKSCTFEPYNISKPAIEIFSQSEATFHLCQFQNADVVALKASDRSSIKCSRCTFVNTPQMALSVGESSRCHLTDCTFNGPCQKHAVYVFFSSEAEIIECTFTNIHGRGIYGLEHVIVSVLRSKFEKCTSGGAVCHASSILKGTECYMENVSGVVFQAGKNSQLICRRCLWENCQGRALEFELSTGLVDQCLFKNIGSPSILCYGPNSNPVICNCATTGAQWPSVIIRDCATPRFYNCDFSESKHRCCTISDFAHPSFIACKLRGGPGEGVCVTNGAQPVFCGCEFIDFPVTFDVSNLSVVSLLGNSFVNCKEMFHVIHGGSVELQRANISKHDSKSFTFGLKPDFSIVEEDEVENSAVLTAPIIDEFIENLKQESSLSTSQSLEASQDIPILLLQSCPMCPPSLPVKVEPPQQAQDVSSPARPTRGSLRETRTLAEVVNRPPSREPAPPSPSPSPESSEPPATSPGGDASVQARFAQSYRHLASNPVGAPRNRKIEKPQVSRLLFGSQDPPKRDPSQGETRGSLRQGAVSMQVVPHRRLQDMGPSRSLKLDDFVEITELDPCEEGMETAAVVMKEMETLRNALPTLGNKSMLPKDKILVVADVVTAAEQKKGEACFEHAKCHCCEEEAAMICIPCGHHAWCEKCVPTQFQTQCVLCPICTGRVVKVTKAFPCETCAFCMDRVADTTVLPCGHRCLCYECAMSLWPEKKQCPMCNSRAQSFRYSFPV